MLSEKLDTMDIKKLYIEATVKTPVIDLDHLSGELIISGKSIPENAALIYDVVLKWVSKYVKSPRPTTNLRLNLEYFNTASALWLAKIVSTLTSIDNNECTLIIHVYFSIEDFNSMEEDDLKDELHPIIHMIGNPTLNVAIKVYATDDNGEILKELMVLI